MQLHSKFLFKKNSNRNLTANFLWARHPLSFQITIQRLLGWSGFFLHQSQGFFKQNVKTFDFDTSRPDELFDNEDK